MAGAADRSSTDGRELSTARKLELARLGLSYWRRRVRLSIGHDEFSARAGVSATELHNLERGYHRVSETTLSQVEQALQAAERALPSVEEVSPAVERARHVAEHAHAAAGAIL